MPKAEIISIRRYYGVFLAIITSTALLRIFIPPHHRSISWQGQRKTSTNCDIFQGDWIHDATTPRYTNLTCRTMDNTMNCMKFGRPDIDFMKWRWKPDGCDLPPFDPMVFLDLMKGKSMVFLGDSLGRNHMHSLICLLSSVTYPITVSTNRTWKFQRYWYSAYNFTIANLWSPFLVRFDESGRDHVTLQSTNYKLYLDEPDDIWANVVGEFDHVIVTVGHWFFRPRGMYYKNKQLVGCILCGDKNITRLSIYYAYKHAFRTTFQTLKNLSNYTGTTFLSTITPQHFENGGWREGGDCIQRSPFQRNKAKLHKVFVGLHKSQLEEFRKAVVESKQRYHLLDITKVLLLRPDGHPSRYGHLPNTSIYNDCVHWCLPGPMDNMNDLFLELLKREMKNKF